MKNISFAIKVAVTVTLSGIVVNKVTAAALKLTNKTSHTITIENVSLLGVSLFSQEKKPKLPMILEPNESLFYDAGVGGFRNVEISVKNKAYLRKTFKLNIEGMQSFHLWEVFIIGSEDDNDESLILMGTGGILK